VKAGYETIWNALLAANHSPASYDEIRRAVRLSDGMVEANIGKTVKDLYRAGVLSATGYGDSAKYSVKDQWVNSRLFSGTPSKLSDGNWGARVTLRLNEERPRENDLVIITTRHKKVLTPRRVIEVVKRLPHHHTSFYTCRVEEVVSSKWNEPIPAKPEEKTPPPATESARPSAIAMAQIRAELKAQVDAQVEAAVKERLRPTAIEVKLPDKSSVTIEGAHYLFPRLVKLVGAGFHVFMHGPPGTGKTTAALQVAMALKRKAEIDTLDPTTARSMIQGYMTPIGDPVHNVFTRCWEQGAIYVADEIDLAPGHVQTLFNGALANGYASLAWGNVAQSSDFGFVATGNTAGRPTAAFPDRRPMSQAFMDRLYFMYWPLDASIETRAVGLKPPRLPAPDTEKCEPQTWVVFVQLLREWAKTNAPTLSITPRASLLGIKALALGESPSNVADALIFRGCDSELRDKALRNVSWR
jgi:hypothetical protein